MKRALYFILSLIVALFLGLSIVLFNFARVFILYPTYLNLSYI